MLSFNPNQIGASSLNSTYTGTTVTVDPNYQGFTYDIPGNVPPRARAPPAVVAHHQTIGVLPPGSESKDQSPSTGLGALLAS